MKQIEFSNIKVLLISEILFLKHSKMMNRISAKNTVIVLDAKIAIHEKNTLDLESIISNYDDMRPLDSDIRCENDAIAINFTSGTTGNPKAVIYTHRAAYLHAIGQVLMINLNTSSKYYWSLPMFHVNGWGHMWAAPMVGAEQYIDANENDQASPSMAIRVRELQISHLAGSPRLVRQITDAIDGNSDISFKGLTILTGGASPTPSLIEKTQAHSINLIHQYGLNETCGPYVVCEPQDKWSLLSKHDATRKRLQQGVPAIHAGTGLRVVDNNKIEVPRDGVTMGEVIMAGNTLAKEYYNNAKANEETFIDGWFYSGDIAVVDEDGYIQIKDRKKELIHVTTAYGWENVSSLEIEAAISQVPCIIDVAVVGALLEGGDHLVIAFFEAKDVDFDVSVMLEKYCEKILVSYKVPRYFFEYKLPKTETGKIRKNILQGIALDKISSKKAQCVAGYLEPEV